MDDRDIRMHEMRENTGPMLAAIAVGLLVLSVFVFLFVGLFFASSHRSMTTTSSVSSTTTAAVVTAPASSFSDVYGDHMLLEADNGSHRFWVYTMTDLGGNHHAVFGIDTDVVDTNPGGTTITVDDGTGTVITVDKSPPAGSSGVRIVTSAGLTNFRSALPQANIDSLVGFLISTRDAASVESILLSITVKTSTSDLLSTLGATPAPAPAPVPPATP